MEVTDPIRLTINEEMAYISLQFADGFHWLYIRGFFEEMERRGDQDSKMILDTLYNMGNICRYVEKQRKG